MNLDASVTHTHAHQSVSSFSWRLFPVSLVLSLREGFLISVNGFPMWGRDPLGVGHDPNDASLGKGSLWLLSAWVPNVGS